MSLALILGQVLKNSVKLFCLVPGYPGEGAEGVAEAGACRRELVPCPWTGAD